MGSRRIALRVLVTGLATLAILGALEAGARMVRGTSTAAPGLDWLQYSARIGWQSRPGSGSDAFAAERRFDGNGLLTIDSEGATPEGRRGKRLVLLLGDSRTFGNGVRQEQTYGQLLERRLPGLDVINRAFLGYSSLQGRIALEEDTPRFRPDVVVFAFDFNDRRYVLHPSEVDGPRQWRRLARLDAWDRMTGSLALVQLVRSRRALGPDREAERALDLGGVRPRVSAEDFRANLEAVARHSADHRMTLVFLLLNDNVTESRPMEEGARALRAGRLDAAEPILRAAVDAGNVFSDAARRQLASLYERTGRREDAARVRVSPRTFYSVTGGYPIEPGEVYRAIVRDVGARAGVRVVDAGSEVDRVPARYFDFCHFNADGHRVVADLLAAALR